MSFILLIDGRNDEWIELVIYKIRPKHIDAPPPKIKFKTNLNAKIECVYEKSGRKKRKKKETRREKKNLYEKAIVFFYRFAAEWLVKWRDTERWKIVLIKGDWWM